MRKTVHKDEWWFVIVDVIAALTDSIDPSGYLRDLRRRDSEIDKGWGQIAHPLSINTAGGPQKVLCANTEGIFRIIQSIPSPRVESFKRWLARVGYERVKEIEDPELATKRTRLLYKLKEDAQIGGEIAGSAKKKLEKKLGRSLVSSKNFKNERLS